MKKNHPVTGREFEYGDDTTIISTTDPKGIITYVNQDFVRVSGFTEDELLGRNHNVVRHPDMPPAAFQDLWDTVKSGRSWRGIVKNRCKNGDHYWVDAYVTPVYEGGELVGYQSVRSKPKRHEVEAAERLYRRVWDGAVKRFKSRRRLRDLAVSTKITAAFVVMMLMIALAGAVGLRGMAVQESALQAHQAHMSEQLQALEQWRANQQQTDPELTNRLHAVASALRGDSVLDKAHASYERVRMTLLGVIALAALIAAVLVTLLARSVVSPLRNASNVAKAIAGGDLTTPVEVNGTDELAQLTQSMKMMQARLRTVIGRIAEFSGELAGSAEEVSNVALGSNRGMERQKAQTDSVAAAMNEMSAAVGEVARYAGEAAEAAREASQEGSGGREVVAGVVTAISAVARDVDEVAEVIQGLEQRSADIGRIVDVIRGVAEQTNLLALNAAIESARAGEQGRGFAVVAEEVRTLAQRTQGSTEEIQRMIEGLQEQATGAARAIGASRQRSADTAADGERAGQALGRITGIIGQMTDLNERIAAATEQQQVTSDEMNRNLAGIVEVTDSTNDGAQRTAECCEQLALQTADLRRLVVQFKL